MGSNYEKLGASASKSGLHDALSKAGLEDSSGYFAQICQDPAGDDTYAGFIHCDGAGTKSIVSYLRAKEGAGSTAFAGLAQDALAMNLDDIFCIGTPSSMLMANAIARNAKLIDDEALGAIFTRYKQLASMLHEHGVEIVLGGGETADMGDVVRTLVVDAVLTGRIKRERLINADGIIPGDVIVGISGTGKASYEKEENSGIASNGLTLARHTLLSSDNCKKYPEIVDPAIDSSVSYTGPYNINDSVAELGMTVGEALASPTRTFAPVLKKIYETLGGNVHGVIHATGGGLSKVLRFGKGNRYIKDDLLPTPPIFSLIQKTGNIDWREMYQVFNMGQRIEVYLPAEHAKKVIDIAQSFSIESKVIGRVENHAGAENTVEVKTAHGEFSYSLSR